MLFTWDTQDLCIVYRWWHIDSTLSLVLSLLAIVAFVAGYEALREAIRQFEVSSAKRVETVPRRWFLVPFITIGFSICFCAPSHSNKSHALCWLLL